MMTMRAWLVALGMAVGSSALALTQGPPASVVNVDAEGVALHGRDPVAYFSEGEAVPGVARFEHQWMGARWRFASAANRDTFAKAPEKYAPQFGGYCSWAVSRNYTADTDPNAFAVVNGKLYLNYDADVQKKWESNIPGHISKADKNWPLVLGK